MTLDRYRIEQRTAVLGVALLAFIMILTLIMPMPTTTWLDQGYTALHTILEVFAIAVAAMVFSVTWATQRYRSSLRTRVLGLCFLGVALLDMSHMLSFQDMPYFVTPGHPEKAINFWLAARLLAMGALVYVAWLPHRVGASEASGVQGWWGLGAVLLFVVLCNVWFLYFPHSLPRTFIEGEGLAPFKIGVEYFLIAGYVVAAWGFWQKLQHKRSLTLVYLVAASLTTVMSEAFFTRYEDVTDTYNLLGHVYKIVGYVFLYRALFVETVQQPYQQLKASQARLEAMIAALPDPLFELDVHDRYLAVYTKQSGQLVAPVSELVGRSIDEVLPPDAAVLYRAAIKEARRYGISRGTRIQLEVPDGLRYFEISVAYRTSGMLDSDTFLVLSRDVTEVVRQEQRFIREAELNAALLALQNEASDLDEGAFFMASLKTAQQFIQAQGLGLLVISDDQTRVESLVTLGSYVLGSEFSDPETHISVPDTGVLTQVLRECQPVVLGAQEAMQGAYSLPGHCKAFQQLACIPALEGGVTRLVLIVCDKPDAYEASEIERLKMMVAAVWVLFKRRRQEATIHRLFQTLDQSPYPVIITDAQARIEYVNKAFTQVSGYAQAEVLGKNPRILQSGTTPVKTYQSLWSTLHRHEPWYGEITNRRKDGTVYSEHALIYPVLDSHGRITNYVAHKEDITQRKATEERLRQLSLYDQLTGLLNKQTFDRRVGRALADLPEQQHAALLWLDLDNFKVINDSLGHAYGDQLLVEISNRLRTVFDDGVILSRQSGDAFVAYMMAEEQSAIALIASEILHIVQEPIVLGDNEISVSASMGVALYPSDATTVDSLSSCAEVAMYRMKQEGRNGLRFYAPGMQENTERALALSSSLKQAIERNELFLVFQPQLDLTTGQIVGAEALLRWSSPEWGMVSPGEFIPLAEQSGFIVTLGAWVFERAVCQVRHWMEMGFGDLTIAVNVSALQFEQKDCIDFMVAKTREMGVPTRCIEIELTEAVALKNPHAAGEKIDRLSQLGFTISIDDFGTGYSSMSYLKRFAVDKLKIDQSFVRELGPDDQAIVSAIIQMAHRLGLTTIAEGVETAEQLAFLQANGCNEIQGYFFGRPMPVKEFNAFWQAHRPEKFVHPCVAASASCI